MRISEKTLITINKFFPKRNSPGRKSKYEYHEAQYNWGETSLRLFPKINFKDKTVLDAGCGLGGKSVFFQEKGAKVFGIDMDENFISGAKEITKSKNIDNIEFFQGSLDEQPFESDKFDIIFLNDVVEHIRKPILISALKECKRVLKKGGEIYLEFPPWESRDAAHLYDHIYMPWCHVFFSDKTLINVSEKLSPPKRHGELSVTDHYLELNKITKKQFNKIVTDLGFKIISIRSDMLFYNKLKYIPFFNKYLTDRVVAVLSK